MPELVEQTEQASKKERYLRAIALAGTLTAGCKAARVSPHTVYQWREMDDSFVFSEREAQSAFADALEQEAVRRAWHGIDKPVYQGGELVGHIREYSDSLLIFTLKAVRPEKYRDRYDVTTGGQPIQRSHEDLDAAIERRLAQMAIGSQGADEMAPAGSTEATDA